MLEPWRRNVYILMVTSFVASSGMSVIMPFLPLYVEQLGVKDPKAISMWSAIAYSANFFAAAIFSPIWGSLADRFGRKMMMLRSGFGMGIIIFLMGTVHSVQALAGLRLLNGVIAGFIAASNAFVASNTPREHVGYALGLIQGASVAGNIMGPLYGGVMVHFLPVHYVFFATSAGLLIASSGVLLFVVEEFKRPTVSIAPLQIGPGRPGGLGGPAGPGARPQAAISRLLGNGLSVLVHRPVFLALLFGTFLAQFSQSTVEPIITLFVQTLKTPAAYLTIMVGMAFSAAGFSTFIAAPILGRYGDRRGSKRVLQLALAGAAALYLPQGLVQTGWQLLWVRLALGAFIGGIMPSIQALISRLTPGTQRATAFGLNQSAVYVGNFTGPLVGGLVSGWLGFRAVFFIASALLFCDLLWITRMAPDPQAQRAPALADGVPGSPAQAEALAAASSEQ